MAWTDERMDDLATSVKDGFARVDVDIRELRAEIKDVRTEIKSVRDELKGDIADLRTELKGDIAALKSGMNRWAVTIVLVMVGLIGTNLAPGVGG